MRPLVTRRRVFGERGTVGDAAVALTLCSCVAMPMYCGPGGGMVALYYRKSTGKTWFVDGREKSPSAASKSFYKPGNSSVRSVLSIAVPGQMRGLAKLLELTGNNVPWRALFKEAIDLASKGFEVSPAVAQMIALHDHVISSSRALRTVFKPGGTALKAGSKLRQEKMAQTLYELASQGRAGYFYEEHYAKAWLAEITSIGSLMKIQDVKSYEARALPAVTMELQDNITLVTSPPPTTGAITAAIFGIVEQWYQSRELHDDASFLHVLAEAFKFGFGRRSWFGDYNETDHKVLMTLTDRAYTSGLAKRIRRTTVLPPSQYAEEFSADTTEGTAPILLSAPNGDVVGLVSSINSIFGSAVMSELTGIIFNNVMNDFDIPGQTNVWGFPGSRSLNQLEPNRRPVSSLAPVFLFRNGKFLAAAVGTGGGKAITGTAQVLLRVLKMKRTLKEAVDWYRVHHQLVPDTLLVESTIDYGKRAFLSSCLHNIETLYKWPGNVLALSQEDGRVYAMYDHRSTHLANTVDGI
ncbi:scoloptoxin SSD14-like [Amblyomma americanum]